MFRSAFGIGKISTLIYYGLKIDLVDGLPRNRFICDSIRKHIRIGDFSRILVYDLIPLAAQRTEFCKAGNLGIFLASQVYPTWFTLMKGYCLSSSSEDIFILRNDADSPDGTAQC